MQINILRIPVEEGCPGFVFRRPDGFAPIGFGAGFLWAPMTTYSFLPLGGTFWATWHVKGLLHLFFELCQLLLSSLTALRSHLATLENTIVIDKMLYFKNIAPAGEGFRI